MKVASTIFLIIALPVLAVQSVAAPSPADIPQFKSLEQKIQKVVQKVLPATVSLFSPRNGASGSGVVVNIDGLILSAGHVVRGTEQMTVIFPNGEQATAKVLGANYTRDTAMLQITDAKPQGGWPHADLGDSAQMNSGDLVIALGHSGGYDPIRTPPVRFGRFLAHGTDQYLCTDCALIAGDSGGPLFDLNGKVVGIHSSIGESLSSNNHAGISGFLEDWNKLKKSKKWGRMGENSAFDHPLNFFKQGSSQDAVRMLDPLGALSRRDIHALKSQAARFYSNSKPAVSLAAKSTVSIYANGNRISYGTVVRANQGPQPIILTKWSEVKARGSRLVIVTTEGKTLPAEVSGVYPQDDIAVLDYTAASDPGLKPLDLSKPPSVALGSLVLMARPDGNVGSLGVVSVNPRSLRDGDKAYLGVMMGSRSEGAEGIPLQKIMPGSAAAKAGLKAGDIILRVNRKELSGPAEMQTMLQRLQPGSKIDVTFQRGRARKNTTIKLGSLSENTSIRNIPQARMNTMERMGTNPSDVRSNFPNVIQSDMPTNASDVGAPVTNLTGELAGIVIARGSRIKTFIIPTESIRELLSKPPQSLRKAQAHSASRSNVSVKRIEEDPLERVLRLLGKSKKSGNEGR